MSDTEYAKILNFYYRNYNKCPNCHKTNSANKHTINIKCLECGYIINITLSEYINLYQKLSDISTDKSKILTEINNLIDLTDNVKDRQAKFASLKAEYLKIDKDTDKLNTVLKLQLAKLDEMKAEKFTIFNDLLEIYFQRKNIFRDIKSPITTTNKDILMEVYKNEGMVKEKRLKELAKQNKMTESDIKNWLKWFDLVVQYGKKNKALHDLIAKINNTELEYQNNNYNYLIKPYSIKEFKHNMPPTMSKKITPAMAKKATPSEALQDKTIKVIKESPPPSATPPPAKKRIIIKKKPKPAIGGGFEHTTEQNNGDNRLVSRAPSRPPGGFADTGVNRLVGSVRDNRLVGGQVTSRPLGKTITIDPYSNTVTWDSLEGLEHIDIEKI